MPPLMYERAPVEQGQIKEVLVPPTVTKLESKGQHSKDRRGMIHCTMLIYAGKTEKGSQNISTGYLASSRFSRSWCQTPL